MPTPVPGTLGLCNSNAALEGLVADRTSDNVLPEAAIQWDVTDKRHGLCESQLSAAQNRGALRHLREIHPPNWQLGDQEYDDEEVFWLRGGAQIQPAGQSS